MIAHFILIKNKNAFSEYVFQFSIIDLSIFSFIFFDLESEKIKGKSNNHSKYCVYIYCDE